MANINDQYYSGTDRYSDGDIEEELYKMAENDIQLNMLKSEEATYPVIYHMSHLRENIINWYPIQKNQSVLEIGAGCGAITGILCEKAQKVTSVELSKRRAMINYARNKDKNNLEIIIGNFNDIIFEEKYDYVILNGVFEYALSFIEGDEPYIKFLEMCKTFLKEDGKILIAIENRLGLKYFTGAPEDHTGNYYLSLNEYVNNNSVRTFSKQEWKDLLKKCDLTCKFYYPYPDYKFPEEIHTDASLNYINYGREYVNLDEKRFEWLNEKNMEHVLNKEGIMSSFANSFFVEISRKNEFAPVEYAKLSCNRKKENRIITVINDENGRKWVEKFAANEQSKEHIQNLYKNSTKSEEEERVFALPARSENGKCIFEYINEKTLETVLIQLIENKEIAKAVELLKDFYKLYFERFTCSEFNENSDFIRIFGEKNVIQNQKAVCGANLDIVLDNVYQIDNRYCIIDSEWVFDFEIPIKFIIWRSLHDFWVRHSVVRESYEEENYYNEFLISDEEIKQFEKWNKNFSYNWLQTNQLEKYSKEKKYTSMDYLVDLYNERRKITCGLLYDLGEGYSEEHRIFGEILVGKEKFNVKFDLPGDVKIKGIRFDPVEGKACRCIIDDKTFVPMNASAQEGEWDVFLTADPIYEKIMQKEEVIEKTVVISGKIELIKYETCLEMMDTILKKEHDKVEKCQKQLEDEKIHCHQLDEKIIFQAEEIKRTCDLLKASQEREYAQEQVIAHLNATLESIYNSKGWKVLTQLRKILKRK